MLEVSDNLYLCVVARCRGQARVRGEQNSVECLSESDISRVVGGNVMAHLPDASQEEIVGIPLNREVEEILEGLRGARRSQVSGQGVATQQDPGTIGSPPRG